MIKMLRDISVINVLLVSKTSKILGRYYTGKWDVVGTLSEKY